MKTEENSETCWSIKTVDKSTYGGDTRSSVDDEASSSLHFESLPFAVQEHALEEQLVEEATSLLKRLSNNIRKRHDFRQARLETRLQRGEVTRLEVSNPALIDSLSPGKGYTWFTRGNVGGTGDDFYVGGVFGQMRATEATLKMAWAQPFSTSFGKFLVPPVLHVSALWKFLNVRYSKYRLRRAVNFYREHSWREVLERLHVGWQRRRGRVYRREDPPVETLWGPTIVYPAIFLNREVREDLRKPNVPSLWHYMVA